MSFSTKAMQQTSFRAGPYAGMIFERYYSETFLAGLAQISDYLSGPNITVMSKNRNMNIRCSLPYGDGSKMDIVVKSFGRQSFLKDFRARRKGSKARRTWEAAYALMENKIGTPRPVCFMERVVDNRILESYYIVEYVDGIIDFRRKLVRLFREHPECSEFIETLQIVADAIRAMHDAGFLHNDLGNQNIYLTDDRKESYPPVLFVDLNRGRLRRSLSLKERARDMSRIRLPSDLLRVFREMYFGEEVPAEFCKWECFYRKTYAIHANTRKLRHPFRAFRNRNNTEPLDYQYPHPKQMWVWDSRSCQPISLMLSKDRRKYYDRGRHFKIGLATLSGILPVWNEYRALLEGAFKSRTTMEGRIGVALRLHPGQFEHELELLYELGEKLPVFVRLYHHESKDKLELKKKLIRKLRKSGYSVSVALVQDRISVIDPAMWDDFVIRNLSDIGGYVEFVEVGHAINRVKWGIWEPREYRRMLDVIARMAIEYPKVKFAGPAVIDFEYPYLMAALKDMPESFSFNALSHHLYVDRRGAPENRQGRFSLIEKCALARAIARWSQHCDDRLVISEVNWPLKGTGVYSPVGAPYESPGPRYNDSSVSEEVYASYMLRYLLISLCSGLAEKVYWWALLGKGFGLVDNIGVEWRKRPAYEALKNFLNHVHVSAFVRISNPVTGVYFYIFERYNGEQWAMGYSAFEEVPVRIPFSFDSAEDSYGRSIDLASGQYLLSGNPIYLFGISSCLEPGSDI